MTEGIGRNPLCRFDSDREVDSRFPIAAGNHQVHRCATVRRAGADYRDFVRARRLVEGETAIGAGDDGFLGGPAFVVDRAA